MFVSPADDPDADAARVVQSILSARRIAVVCGQCCHEVSFESFMLNNSRLYLARNLGSCPCLGLVHDTFFSVKTIIM